MPSVTFSAKDREGVAHAYVVELHPASEGQAVMWQLVALIAPTLLTGLKGLLPLLDTFRGQKLSSLLDDPQALEQAKSALATTDMAGIGAEIQKALSGSPAKLVAEILSKTTRDGKHISNKLAFDSAYTGNYSELRRAVWEVTVANHFLSLLDM